MVVRHVLEASHLLVDRKQSKDKSGQYKMCSLKTLPSDLLPPLRPHLPILCSACVHARVRVCEMHVHVAVRGVNLECSSSTIHLVFLRQSLSLAWYSLID